MPSSYTTSLRLTLPATGELTGTWGTTVNTGITELLDSAVAGTTTISTWGGAGVAYTLSNTDGAADEARKMFIVASGTPGEAKNVICPAVSKLYFFRNDTTGGFALTLKTSGGSGIAVPAGQYKVLYCNGTNVVEAFNSLASLTLGTALAASSGGTGQSTYTTGDLLYASGASALSKLGIGASTTILTSSGTAPQWTAASSVAIGTATNLAGGAAGSVPYQSGAATTTFLGIGAANTVMTSSGTAPQWSTALTGLTGVSTTTATLSGNLTLSGGTANGVLYLDGSKVATSGTALAFDGTNLNIGSTIAYGFLNIGNGGTTNYATVLTLNGTNNAANGTAIVGRRNGTNAWLIGDTAASLGLGTGFTSYNYGSDPWIWYLQTGGEQMRLTSTGLGIGTSSPSVKLQVEGAANSAPVTLLRLNNSGTTGGGPGIAARMAFTAGASSLGYIQGSNFASGASGLQFSGDGTNAQATLDSAGNVGLGVTPSAWNALDRGIELSLNTGQGFFAGLYPSIIANAYRNAAEDWIYRSSAPASRYTQVLGVHSWHYAPSGTAGNAISFTQALTLDASGNLLLGGTSAGASSAASLAIFNGTAPTGSVTNGIILYAEDVSSSSELKVRDEAGNVTTLSPHNFSLIPEGPSEDMAWAYYSEKGGKRINVDMLKLARMVEKLTGEKLVYES